MRSSASIGVNLRVTGHCRQGGRKYMEDFFSVAYQQTEDEKDLEYAFFGIYDGHGGAEAAAFAKEHLMETIIKHKNFWSDYDEDVLRAIKDGYIATHYAMWKEQEKWPRTASGLPSTAGTTASIAFIRRGKIFIGHVGDSGIILGYQEPGSNEWKAKPLTRDHKPENAEEMQRIKRCGGKVVSKSGVPRVVWNRPRIGHQGPVRRSTPIDEIPFLAVARSLGDLWSYNSQINQFIVSPDPDCSVMKIDTNVHRCLIFGTDGLYNMLSPGMAVQIVQQAERHNEYAALSDSSYKTWLNPSKLLVEKALERWHATKMRADNTSVVTLMLDPPGPPKAQVLKDRKKNLPERGLRIMTRFDDNNQQTQENNNCNNCDNVPNTAELLENPQQSKLDNENAATPSGITSIPPLIHSPHIRQEEPVKNQEKLSTKPLENDDSVPATPQTPITPVTSSDLNVSNFPLKERNFVPKLRESTSFDPREPVMTRNLVLSDNNNGKENKNSQTDVNEDNTIQCNEVSSSNIDIDNLCNEDEEVDSSGSVKQERHNLRSTKKGKSGDLKGGDEEENAKTSIKRKLKSENSPIPRKSMRIDKINSSQKKSQEAPTPHRRAFEAEEKLKKLAEQADLAKKLVGTLPKEKNNSKSEETKKQSSNDSFVAKKKIQLVLEKVKKVQKKGLLNPQKRKLLIVGKPQPNSTKTVNTVVATKVGFQRHLRKNQSQRVQPSTSKSVDGATRNFKSCRIVIGIQNISKEELAKIKTLKKVPEVEVGTSRSRSASATPRNNNVPLNASAKPPKTNTNPQKTNKTKTLGRRLQQKTEILRKTVMLKK